MGKRGPKIGTYCGRKCKPDNEVSYYALYYREKRKFEREHPGETFRKKPEVNYEPAFTKEKLIEMGISVKIVLDDNPILIQHKGRNLKQRVNKFGYVYVQPRGYKGTLLVHRIVYAWFYEEVEEGMTVDHIDGNKTNNTPANLRLLTRADNTRAMQELKKKNFTEDLTNKYQKLW